MLTGRKAVWYKDMVLNSGIWIFRWPGPYLPRRRATVPDELVRHHHDFQR
ncbi:hypothetical protein [Phytoactinopolyspora halophila]|nr:hypothetical protein [Phytoactinopolyspora halophila]